MFEYMPKWERAAKEEEKVKADEIQAIVEESEGSLFKVPVTTILTVSPHTNADRLELVTVYGFQVVAAKGRYKVGDRIIYIPIDSIIPEVLENRLFPEGSKITLNKRRVRQIRIRKLASQGMVIDPSDIEAVYGFSVSTLALETNLASTLGVEKYEPAVYGTHVQGTPRLRNKPKENPRFHKYGGIDNIKWYPTFFEEKEVIIQEKLHGSNCRASYSRAVANTLWKKVKKFFGYLPAHEYCYGSNNVQLQERPGNVGFYGSDVYGDVLKKIDAFSKLKPGETIYGELIGPGIQKGYSYGHKEHHFVLFDVKMERPDGVQEYLDPEAVEAYAKERGFDFVPVLYRGVFNATLAKELSTGPSVYAPSEKVREGVVIKSRIDYSNASSKKALKLINEKYLDDTSNTDNH